MKRYKLSADDAGAILACLRSLATPAAEDERRRMGAATATGRFFRMNDEQGCASEVVR
jgi:hypothetical protein